MPSKFTEPSVPKAVQDCHDLLLWLIPLLDQFPRNRRFTLGEKIENRLLTVLELLTSAAYRSNKPPLLRRANQDLAVVRHLWRLAYELKVIPVNRYEHGGRLIQGVGQQVGGWLRSQSS